MSFVEMKDTLVLLQDTMAVLKSSQIWAPAVAENSLRIEGYVEVVSQALSANWELQFESAVNTALNLAVSVPLRKEFVAKKLFNQEVENIVLQIDEFIEILEKEFEKTTSQLIDLPIAGDLDLLKTEAYMTLSKLRLASALFPWVIQSLDEQRTVEFPLDLLNGYDGPLAVTGAAGYGKTSFCRMSTLADSTSFVNDQTKPLPVYVPLHQFNLREVTGEESPEELFFGEEELRRYVDEKRSAGDELNVRAYLDGLDEVTDNKRRRALLQVARSASKKGSLQIIITSREYVSGDDFDWLPRVMLAEFDNSQVKELGKKWLSSSESARFFTELALAPDLQQLVRVPLMASLTFALFKQIKALPESKVRLYEMFVQLLCGGWDAAKDIRRDSQFGPIPKRTVITRLAWMVHYAQSRDFSDVEFRSAVKQSLGDLVDRYRSLLQECIQDGILVRIGDRYAFAHLSFQEFLAAKFIGDPFGSILKTVFRNFLGGDVWWEEVIRFYLAGTENPSGAAQWVSQVSEQIASRANCDPSEIQNRAYSMLDFLEKCHKGFKSNKSSLVKIAKKSKWKKVNDSK